MKNKFKTEILKALGNTFSDKSTHEIIDSISSMASKKSNITRLVMTIPNSINGDVAEGIIAILDNVLGGDNSDNVCSAIGNNSVAISSNTVAEIQRQRHDINRSIEQHGYSDYVKFEVKSELISRSTFDNIKKMVGGMVSDTKDTKESSILMSITGIMDSIDRDQLTTFLDSMGIMGDNSHRVNIASQSNTKGVVMVRGGNTAMNVLLGRLNSGITELDIDCDISFGITNGGDVGVYVVTLLSGNMKLSGVDTIFTLLNKVIGFNNPVRSEKYTNEIYNGVDMAVATGSMDEMTAVVDRIEKYIDLMGYANIGKVWSISENKVVDTVSTFKKPKLFKDIDIVNGFVYEVVVSNNLYKNHYTQLRSLSYNKLLSALNIDGNVETTLYVTGIIDREYDKFIVTNPKNGKIIYGYDGIGLFVPESK